MKQKLKHISFYFLLPLFLFVFGTFNLVNYLKEGEFGVTNLDVRNFDELVATRPGELLRGDTVAGKFHSKYSNLGLVSLRFYNQDRDSKDTLMFRLREVGEKDWYYEAKYETDQFLPHKHFPFGFPTIKNSVNKEYEFQLESLRGATGSGILLDSQTPIFIAKSSYPKTDLTSDKKLLGYFLVNKFINIFGDPEIILKTVFFFLPLILYFVFLLTEGLSYQYLVIISLLPILYDVFWLEKSYDFLFLSMLFFWGLISFRHRFESRIAAVFALGFLVFTPLLLIFGQDALAEKTAVWAYLFLCISVVQQVYELKKETSNYMSLQSFIRNFSKFKIVPNYWVLLIPKFIKEIYDFNKITLNRLSPEWFVKKFPKTRKEFGVLIKTTPKFFIRLLVLILTILIICILISVLIYILIFPPILSIFSAFSKFVTFYPGSYLQRFVFSVIIPEIILFISLFFIFIKMNRRSKFFIIVMLLVFNFISGKVVSKAIEFENKPRILSISPNSTSEAWTDIVIIGKNFRNIPFVGKLYIDTVEQGGYMVYWSDERIVFRTSPDLTKSGMVQVVPLDRAPSNKVRFEYLYK